MALYEYRCDHCGSSFEELVFADTRVSCPRCAGTEVTKLLSRPAPPATKTASSGDFCPSGAPTSQCCGGACHNH